MKGKDIFEKALPLLGGLASGNIEGALGGAALTAFGGHKRKHHDEEKEHVEYPKTNVQHAIDEEKEQHRQGHMQRHEHGGY